MIKSLPLEENPREKALCYGVDSLNNVELLALILRTGNKNESVLELASRLLKHIDGMDNLMNVSYSSLVQIKGIKQAKAIEILSIIEIAKRMKEKSVNPGKILNPKDIYTEVKSEMMLLKQEHFVVLCLDNQNCLLKKKTIFKGSLNMSVVTPREVFKEAIEVSSAKIVLVHNHPSGNAMPSHEDVELTRHFCALGEMMSIEVIDHIIIGWNQFYSITAQRLYDDNNVI